MFSVRIRILPPAEQNFQLRVYKNFVPAQVPFLDQLLWLEDGTDGHRPKLGDVGMSPHLTKQILRSA